MKKPVQLIEILPTFSELEVAELAITDGSDTIVPGNIVFAALNEYLLRYCILEGNTTAEQKISFIFGKYKQWLSVRQPDIVKMLQSLYADYDPLSDYSMHEKEVKLREDGEDTTTVKSIYDYTTTDEADGADKPTYSTYTTTFDDQSERLESKRIDEGKRTTHTVADDEDKNVKTTAYTHTEAELTVDDETYTADKIDYRKRDAEGHVHTSAQKLISETIDLYMHSVLQGFLKEFIDKYTYYVGLEGRCFL